LESEGITCFVKDELTVQVHPFISNAIGGVKLQVKESDLSQTIEILKETGYIKDDNLQVSKKSHLNKNADCQYISTKGEKIICPYCGSEEVVKPKKAGLLFLLTSLLFLFLCPTPFLQNRYYCFDCKQEFKRKRKRGQI
jgi:DNA-directed RNA polymerase subunit RPC12/RpoP